MPVFKPKGLTPYSLSKYKVIQINQKAGWLFENDTTKYPKAFSYVFKKDTKHSIMLGYELETFIEKEGEDPTISAVAQRIAKSRYGHFCNLRSEYYATFEMVSVPATLNFHRKTIEKYLDMSGFTSNWNNGMHVHISKKSFNELTLIKFISFINNKYNRDFIEFVAGRKLNNFCAPNKYIDFITFDKDRGNLILKAKHGTGKYCAVNTVPRTTVELRIFKAPTNKEKLISNLEFTEALVNFVNSFEKLQVSAFIKYVWENKNKYKYLCNDLLIWM